MRKTVDLSEADIAKIEEYGKEKGIKTFTESMRSIISSFGDASCSCNSDNMSDENFALIADALVEMDKKLDIILTHFAPKSAGEVK